MNTWILIGTDAREAIGGVAAQYGECERRSLL